MTKCKDVLDDGTCKIGSTKGLCNHPKHGEFMMKYCARSCKKCQDKMIVETDSE